jgi:hypothetical protein
MLAVVFALFAGAQAASAKDFTIRKLTLQGGDLHLYHDHVDAAGDADVTIQVGGKDCAVEKGKALLRGRGGDKLTVLIVLDRGGTETSGMGQYTPQIKGAVGRFIADMLSRKTGDQFAIIDSPGRNREAGRLNATADGGAVQAFLDNLPAPAGSGADVYGTANAGLGMLDTDTRLRAVVIVSDGVDPAAEAAGNDQGGQQALIQEAQRRGIPVSAVLIERAGEKGRTPEMQFRGQRGRKRLLEVVNATNAEFRAVPAGEKLEPDLQSALYDLAQLYAQVDRTTCKLCGNYAGSSGHIVDMRVAKGSAEAGRSRGEPMVQLVIPPTEFGACDGGGGGAVAIDGGPNECKDDKTCAPCGTCKNGRCSARVCQKDVDCGPECTCEVGNCRKRKTLQDYVPYGIGFVGLLGVGLLAFAAYRKRKRQEAAAAAAREQETQERRAGDERRRKEQAEREAQVQGQLAAERSERERSERAAADRAAEQAKEVERLKSEQARSQAELAERMNPVLFRLVSTAESEVAIDRPLRAGSYILGARAPADIVLDASQVSGQHARLIVQAGGVASVEDLGSANGTFVNRFRIGANAPVELRPGDELALSKRVLVQLVAAAGPGPAPGGGGGAKKGRTVLEE